MAVKLRLTRRGKKKQPFYRIVATDSRTARDGKYIEKIGYYNPLPEPAEILIDEEKSFYWLDQGALPTDTVKNLLSQKGIILKWSLMRKGLDEATIQNELKKWEAVRLEQMRKKEALIAQAQREKESAESKAEKADQIVVQPEVQHEEKAASVESTEEVTEIKQQETGADEARPEIKTEEIPA